MPYRNSFTTTKSKLLQENSSSALQSLELSWSSEIDYIIQKEEAIFKKNPTVGLPEVSKLIDSAISKGNWIRYEHPEYHITWWIVLRSNEYN